MLTDVVSQETLLLEGPSWDYSLVRNCRLEGVKGDGIVIRNVKGVVVQGCYIADVEGTGIRLSSTGSSSDVVLEGNRIVGAGENGISAAQRYEAGVDHQGLKILDNYIENSGARSSKGLTHGIYVQTEDSLVEGNTIAGTRDGNGISIRSSGEVRCNRILGISSAGKPAIRYYSDHVSGASKALVIDSNDIDSETVGIELYDPVELKDRPGSIEHLVSHFVIRGNAIRAPIPLKISKQYDMPPFSIVKDVP
ncbi:right-handed parallel beta-helix repeat-containing protein [Microvirga sp. KLBC 81]|uniref:right-handed parallel beta-helix repeat-containing protein n=1 Tax=Microvirga sp. KLBC 81 TaxID=1862707 RepID=UPI001403898C|nr:right-handed parallel beta-helix repeat-containing protein [Microvirga sp. KLBC 81]